MLIKPDWMLYRTDVSVFGAPCMSEPFSQFLGLLRLRAQVFHNARVCGQWRIQMPDSGHSGFHMPTQGECRLIVPGHLETVLNTGDLVIFPREMRHHMEPMTDMQGEQRHLPYGESQEIPGTSLICGRVDFRHQAHSRLLDALPAVFILRHADEQRWLDPLLGMILAESMQIRCGTSVILDRLSELLFTYAVRQFAESNPQRSGVLALYANPRLRLAIAAMHDRPAHPWTVQELASCAAMSRTVFSGTFKRVSGWAPMQYLIWWRMQQAWLQLKSGSTVANVADTVGYRSEAAFSRAFKQEFGVAAGSVRKVTETY